jgi:hypothetical protein
MALTVLRIVLMVLGGNSWHPAPQLAPEATPLIQFVATGSGV